MRISKSRCDRTPQIVLQNRYKQDQRFGFALCGGRWSTAYPAYRNVDIGVGLIIVRDDDGVDDDGDCDTMTTTQ